jgi:hypothetical protein
MLGHDHVEFAPAGLNPLAPTSLPRGRVARTLAAMAEEMRAESPFGLQGAHENIWHIARAERWSDGQLIGHRTFSGRNYPASVDQRNLEGLDQVCSDCTAQVSQSH